MNRRTVIIATAIAALPLIFTAPSVSSHARTVALVAHRGASFDAPENTVAAARLAWAQNADAVETDIRLTKDGEVIVSHDPTTKRINGSDKPIAEMTLAEVRSIDAGRRKGPQFAGEKLPTLDELIATIPDGKRLFVELKTGPEILPALGESLARTHATGNSIVLISFDREVLRQAHERWPTYPTLWLVQYDPATSLEQVVRQAHEAGFSGLDVSANWPMDSAAVSTIRASHLQLHVWTVDSPYVAQDWTDLGVDGITTNRAGWLRSQLHI